VALCAVERDDEGRETLVANNRGGEEHTFTEVEEFGAGSYQR
jgi:hypothetical protein